MEKGKVYPLIEFIDDIKTKTDVLTYFDIILGIVSEEGPLWDRYKTRTGTRFINEIQFDEDFGIIIPECFADIHTEITILVGELLKIARKTITDESIMIPLQLFLSYYRNGKDICPMHSHECRQITLSIGSDRTMTVGSERKNLYNGSVIYLHKERHGILKEESNDGNRVSFNLFYTTSKELDHVE